MSENYANQNAGIRDLVAQADAGRLVLPSFQRSFVWEREQICAFLESIALGYFLGTVLQYEPSLEQRAGIRVRRLEGAETAEQPDATLLMDGQQRLTTLLNVIKYPDIEVSDAKSRARTYFDVEKWIGGQSSGFVEAVLLSNRKQMAAWTAREPDARVVLFRRLFDDDFTEWLFEHGRWSGQERRRITDLHENVKRTKIPVFTFTASNTWDYMAGVFARINYHGVPLDEGDLANAQLEVKGIKLEELWARALGKLQEAAGPLLPTADECKRWVLRTICLLQGMAYREESVQKLLMTITRSDFERQWDRAVNAQALAYARMRANYGARTPRMVGTQSIVAPLGCLLLRVHEKRAGAIGHARVDAWYWTGLLTGRYGSSGAANTKAASDVAEIGAWIDGQTEPDWIGTAELQFDDLAIAKSTSALYKSALSFFARGACADPYSGNSLDLHIAEVEEDHVFAKSKYSRDPMCGGALNRMLVSKGSNGAGGKSDLHPSEALTAWRAAHGSESSLNEDLATHMIGKDAVNALTKDDLKAFVKARFSTMAESLIKIQDRARLVTLGTDEPSAH